MKIYDLETTFDFGEFKGKALKDVFANDPEYVEECILDIPDFCIDPSNIDSLEDLHPEFAFSEEAVEKLEQRFEAFNSEEIEPDRFENFNLEDLSDIGIEDLDDDFDDLSGEVDYYDDGLNI